MKVHYHPKITVEVRRELFGSAAWREERTTVVGGGEQQRLGGGRTATSWSCSGWSTRLRTVASCPVSTRTGPRDRCPLRNCNRFGSYEVSLNPIYNFFVEQSASVHIVRLSTPIVASLMSTSPEHYLFSTVDWFYQACNGRVVVMAYVCAWWYHVMFPSELAVGCHFLFDDHKRCP